MKLLLYLYECKNCKAQFKSPELLGIPYGEFLMRSDIGELAYLYAVDDNIFKGFYQLLKSNKRLSCKKAAEIAKVQHKIYGYICDKSPNLYSYHIGRKPSCPHCGGIEMAAWEPTIPPETVEQKIPKITYLFWEKLKEEDKIQLVNNLIDKYIFTI